ncbi:hypothetical protein Cyrtocomes_00409 [Candidatus Cyrtobacter comes]|uniref:Uncharacterized protein n=1 Tax=Candidatus Cyrtobacter comes TaxID=675776 RepID=A0ABU5L7F0_9RICK|nr:hypothetical protein [Candidatus Cyrtobacter comes]
MIEIKITYLGSADTLVMGGGNNGDEAGGKASRNNG